MTRPDKPSNQGDSPSAGDSRSPGASAAELSSAIWAERPGSTGTDSAVRQDQSEAKRQQVKPAELLPVPAADPVALARQAIALHEKKDTCRSYLGKAISFVTRGDEKALENLKQLTENYDRAVKSGNTQQAEQIKQALSKAIERDTRQLERQDDIAHYGAGFLKAAGLFMRGKAGLFGTAAAYVLDQMNPNDAPTTQALDGGLGLTKGLALKGIFHRLGQAEVGIAAKGVGLGVSSRFADLALTRQTYLDAGGNYRLEAGLGHIAVATVSREALLTDVVVFGVAHGIVRGSNSITHGAIDRSPLASTMLTAGSFGLLSGSSAEVHKQLAEGKSLSTLDYSKIVKKGLIQGTVDLAAGAPGGMQARAAMTPPVEAIRKASETRSVARQLASDTRFLEIGSAKQAGEFFTRLARALTPEAHPASRAALFRFLEKTPEIQPGVRRFLDMHPDQAVKSVLNDFFNCPLAVRLSYTALSGRLRPSTASGCDKKAATTSDTAAESERRSRRADLEAEARREAPGVYSRTRKGELWEPERDITKIPADFRAEEVRHVRSPLFAYEPLETMAAKILQVAGGWKIDLRPKAKEVDVARSRYEAAAREARDRLIETDMVRINEMHKSELVREYLAGYPELRRIYDNYVEARALHGQKLSELNEAIKQRGKQLQDALNEFAQGQGLPPIRLHLYDDIGLANAQYRSGKGIIELRKADVHDTADISGLTRKLIHEFTHSKQDGLMIRHIADLLDIGAVPTKSQAYDLKRHYENLTEKHLDRQWMFAVLRARRGTHLTAEQTQRAKEMIEAFRKNKPPGEDFADTGNHFRITRRVLADMDQVNQGYIWIEKLGADKSGRLSLNLFGQPELPPRIEQLVRLRERFERSKEVEWPEVQVRRYLKVVLSQRLEQLNQERVRIFADYMAGLHEREAWLVAERGRMIAEGKGATKPDTTKHMTPEQERLRAVLEQLNQPYRGQGFTE